MMSFQTQLLYYGFSSLIKFAERILKKCLKIKISGQLGYKKWLGYIYAHNINTWLPYITPLFMRGYYVAKT